VDALSTAIIMGETEAVGHILKFIPTIDFGTTSTEVSLFETTIRYIGGLLSGLRPRHYRVQKPKTTPNLGSRV